MCIRDSDDSDPLSPPLDASVTLDETQTRRLTEAARRHRITLNTLLQAAWSRVLAQATGHDTVAFGVTTSGRPDSLADAGRILGLFINTVALVVPSAANQELGEWLRAIQAQNLASREAEHVPLADVQRWAGHNGRALFDTLLVLSLIHI